MHGADLAKRLQFDFRILRDMRGPTFDFSAFASPGDRDQRRNEIKTLEDATRARKYKMVLRVPTLVAAGEFARETEFAVDLDVGDYPEQAPAVWVRSQVLPWSPHFRRGSPVCTGEEFWAPRRGHVTLGHLVQHLQRLLNWDEKGRGPGYVGWNGEAIAYHQRVYQGRPLDPEFMYAPLPAWLVNPGQSTLGFEVLRRSGAEPDFQVI